MNNSTEDTWLLRERFISLLDQQEDEQVYQKFIEKNTALIPREFIQNHGIHMDLVFRKLLLGSDYATDFCYLSKSSDDWHIVLIEIEKPQSKYFKGASTKLHPDFHAALDQIIQWKAWFSHRANHDAFVDGILGQLRQPLQFNPCKIKYVLVHGRRAEFAGDEIRTRIIGEHEDKDLQIVSYDSLAEALPSKGELYLGVKKNDHIEILSERYISEELFAYLPPSYLRITGKLRSSIFANKNSWHHVSLSSSHKYVLEDKLLQIGILRDIETS